MVAIPTDIVPVILSGGAGTRLWPLSRELYPKQLLKMLSANTLLQDTALRFGNRPMVVCNHEHRFIVAEQLREVDIEPRRVVIEPVGRNTAPAVAVAALLAEPDDLLLVMPSDHSIRNVAAFRQAVEQAARLARCGHLVTFGIQPDEPNTGYGYIRQGQALEVGFTVAQFVEKPDLPTAQSYLQSGDYLWNSGIFLFSARTYLTELERLQPEMVVGCRQALAEGSADLFFFRLGEAAFSALTGQSIDYAVMEHTDRAAVVPLDMGWSDIGSWSALWQESPRDENDNALIGDVIALNTTGSYIRGDRRLVATLGVKDLVVMASDDVVLVADKAHDQQVKRIVEQLKAQGRSEAVSNIRCWRPWGWYQTVDAGERFLVKHIKVNPGSKLSLQKHWHRSEHWIVVTGTALVTRGEESFVLRENESTFIPAGTVHRLENPGKVPLRMIEVQSGEYIGEDDIVRIEDVYGRA